MLQLRLPSFCLKKEKEFINLIISVSLINTDEGKCVMQEKYDLELDAVEAKIKTEKAKIVCIQLPDGLKPQAQEIVKELEKRTGAKVITWLGSCWGACDVPLEVNRLGVDLLVQWGHSEWGH